MKKITLNFKKRSYKIPVILAITLFVIFNSKTFAQSITIDATDLKQKIEYMGGDVERTQRFIPNATNAQEIVDWIFKDTGFDICRVAYDKAQVTEKNWFYTEGTPITTTGSWAQWEIVTTGSYFFIRNNAADKHLIMTGNLIDGGTANQIYAIRKETTGNQAQWTKITADGEWFYLNNRARNKYLQCVSEGSPTNGLHIRGSSTLDYSTQWREVDAGNGQVFLENRDQNIRLRYTNVDGQVLDNMAFYDPAIETMKMIKIANPNMKFLATMRSDYTGYKSGNINSLPEYIYDYACVEYISGEGCQKEIGTKNFYADKYAVFLADYLELMHTNGLTISYLAFAKEWSAVVTEQRSHATYIALIAECSLRSIPMPEIIGPATWGLNGGKSFVNTVKSLGYEDEYKMFSSHNLSHDNSLYAGFVAAATAAGKHAMNDESTHGSGQQTSGENPDMSILLDAYVEKTEQYKAGLHGELFFEICTDGTSKTTTRPISWYNGTTVEATGKRIRAYYVLKDYAIQIKNKTYVTSLVSSLADIYTMSVIDDENITLLVVNDSDSDANAVPINLSNANLTNAINQITWTETDVDEGVTTTLIKNNDNLFTANLKAKSISIFTANLSSSPLSVDNLNKSAVKLYPNPSSKIINVSVDNSISANDIDYSVIDIKGGVIKKGKLDSSKKIDITSFSKGLYILNLRSESFNQNYKIIKN